MDQNLKSIISRIPAWHKASSLAIERIGGLTNANYRVVADGEAFVLRVSGPNTASLGINRANELAALKAAAKAGIGPEVVTYLEPEGHLVTRWVDGRIWEASEFRTPENVRLLTDTARRIHALPLNGATFSPSQRVKAYLQTAQKFEAPLPANLESCLETMQAVKTDQENDPSDWLHFCHNDLVSVNYLYLEDERKLTVLDWEFSGLGDIYYDLATIVYTHDNVGPIPQELEEVMLSCYFATVTNAHRRRLAGMKYMLMLFTGLWGLAQQGMVLAGLIPAVDGFHYGKFAEYLFTHEIREMKEQYLSVAKIWQ
jgi:thiamine kinase-like enzyme